MCGMRTPDGGTGDPSLDTRLGRPCSRGNEQSRYSRNRANIALLRDSAGHTPDLRVVARVRLARYRSTLLKESAQVVRIGQLHRTHEARPGQLDEATIGRRRKRPTKCPQACVVE